KRRNFAKSGWVDSVELATVVEWIPNKPTPPVWTRSRWIINLASIDRPAQVIGADLRPQQFTEVPLPHQTCGDRGYYPVGSLNHFESVKRGKEEVFILFNGPAHNHSVFILLHWAERAGEKAAAV